VLIVLNDTSFHAALWLLRVLSSSAGHAKQQQRRVSYMQQQGFYALARGSLSDQAASNCVSQLLEDVDVSLLNTRQPADGC
jgi:hypothetical protein